MEKALAAQISRMIVASLRSRNGDELASDNIGKIRLRKRRLRRAKLRKRLTHRSER